MATGIEVMRQLQKDLGMKISRVPEIAPNTRLVQPFKVHTRQSIWRRRFFPSRGTASGVYRVLMRKQVAATSDSTRLLLLVALFVGSASTFVAQTPKPSIKTTTINAEQGLPGTEESQTPSALELELRAKREIKFAEKEHQENLGRAKEASDLGKEIAAAFNHNKSLSRNDLKNLDKLEKLTKRIRSEAGASDEEVTLDERPNDLATAVNCLAKVSAALGEKVQKTPRRVVSTAIIDQANVLLELIQVVRSLARQ